MCSLETGKLFRNKQVLTFAVHQAGQGGDLVSHVGGAACALQQVRRDLGILQRTQVGQRLVLDSTLRRLQQMPSVNALSMHGQTAKRQRECSVHGMLTTRDSVMHSAW